MQVDVVWPVAATLGEGPVWVRRDAALWFVDIKGQRVHRFHPDTGERRSWDAPERVGWVLPAADGGYVAGLKSGLHRFDPDTGSFTPLVAVEPHLPGNRLNDAAVDPAGRLWFGSMDDGEEAPSGGLFRLMPDGSVARAGPECTITNGPAISPDGSLLYHVDTLGGTIHRHRIGSDGSLDAGALFVTIDPADGHPDGAVCDAQGHVWIGLWGGGRARRYAPDGSIEREVAIPAPNVTKVAFGGADLCDVYVSTARIGLSDEQLARFPDAGGLFRFRSDVPGIAGAEIREGV